MTQQHRIIPGSIGIESLERKLFTAEVLQRPVSQFVTTSFMLAGDNCICLQILVGTGLCKHFVDLMPLSDIGNDQRIGAKPGQIKLVAVVEQSAVNRSPEVFPIATFAAKLNILPIIFFATSILSPKLILTTTGKLLDVFVHLATAYIADVEFLAEHEDFLVEKATVNANDDGNIVTILFADFGNHMTDHLLYRVTVVGVLVPASKCRIDNQSTPVHLQWLKALFLFICRLNPMATFGIIVVNDHGVNAKLDESG
jgi:hypothetical protein